MIFVRGHVNVINYFIIGNYYYAFSYLALLRLCVCLSFFCVCPSGLLFLLLLLACWPRVFLVEIIIQKSEE